MTGEGGGGKGGVGVWGVCDRPVKGKQLQSTGSGRDACLVLGGGGGRSGEVSSCTYPVRVLALARDWEGMRSGHLSRLTCANTQTTFVSSRMDNRCKGLVRCSVRCENWASTRKRPGCPTCTAIEGVQFVFSETNENVVVETPSWQLTPT